MRIRKGASLPRLVQSPAKVGTIASRVQTQCTYTEYNQWSTPALVLFDSNLPDLFKWPHIRSSHCSTPHLQLSPSFSSPYKKMIDPTSYGPRFFSYLIPTTLPFSLFQQNQPFCCSLTHCHFFSTLPLAVKISWQYPNGSLTSPSSSLSNVFLMTPTQTISLKFATYTSNASL